MNQTWLGIYLVSLLFFQSPACYSRDFIILANPQQPFKFQEDSQLLGIDVDIIDLLMKKINVPYEIQLIKSDARIQAQARSGKADMLILFSKKPSRIVYLIYPTQSYVNLTWNFFIQKKDEGRIQFNSLNDLKGLRIGATKDISYTPEFWNAGLNLQMVSRNDLQISKLLKNRIDAVPLNTINTLYEEKKRGTLAQLSYLPKPLKSKPYYNVFTRASNHPDKKRVMEEYDKIIKEMKKDGTIQSIFKKYLGKKNL